MILPQYLPTGNKKKGLAIYGKFADATLILYMNYKVSNFSIAVGCGSQNLLSSNLQRVTLFIAWRLVAWQQDSSLAIPTNLSLYIDMCTDFV